MTNRSSFAGIGLGLALLPLLASSTVLLVLGGAGAQASAASAVCGGAGTGTTISGTTLDAEQLGNAATIVTVTAGRHLSVYAAVVAVTTSYTEVKLRNQIVATDHDSEGLFQQRISIYTKPVADDPVKATNAFLDRLVRVPNWRSAPVGMDAQAVQISKFPQRYQPNAALARKVVGQLWPTAAAAALPHADVPTIAGSDHVSDGSFSGPVTVTEPAICVGAGGASTVGAHGNLVAGITSIPNGFVITGSTKAQVAVRFALRQLGKPYRWAGAGPDAFDCSGLTMAAWAAAGVPLPHLAAGQTSYGTPEPTNLSQAVGGDLVMIPGAHGTPANPGHVGMIAGYLDAHDGRHLYLVQAPRTGVPIELTEATEWAGQIVDVRHLR
jgi:cell wall-associated NlpC family hydrolase